MNVKQVKKVVKDIDFHKTDPESAHNMEDDLYLTILKAIAAGTCDDPKACAREAIKSQDIDFPRWTA